MNVLDLFLKTNILVKVSVLTLIVFSIISWSVVLDRIVMLNIIRNKLKIFENKFWSGIELSKLYQELTADKAQLNGLEQIFYTGFKEFYGLHEIKRCTSEIVISRVFRVMHNTMQMELNILENRVPLIGIIGSTSPYVGLFGTVLGIIHVFFELGKVAANNMDQAIHIQIIIPGIAESLVSTAIGLFVAIPSYVIFNYLNVQINNLDKKYNNFIEEFITILHRQIFFRSDIKLDKQKKYGEISEK